MRFNKVLFFLAYGKNESKRATFNAMFFSNCNYSIILRVQILTKWKNFHWNLNAFQISSFKTLFLVFFSSFAWDINSVAGIKYKLLNRTDLENLVCFDIGHYKCNPKLQTAIILLSICSKFLCEKNNLSRRLWRKHSLCSLFPCKSAVFLKSNTPCTTLKFHLFSILVPSGSKK